jgi:hypothetical protein
VVAVWCIITWGRDKDGLNVEVQLLNYATRDKEIWGSERKAPRILRYRMWVVSLTPQPLYLPGKRFGYPLARTGGPFGFHTVRYISCLAKLLLGCMEAHHCVLVVNQDKICNNSVVTCMYVFCCTQMTDQVSVWNDMYSGNAGLESRPAHRLSWLRLCDCSIYRHILRKYLLRPRLHFPIDGT